MTATDVPADWTLVWAKFSGYPVWPAMVVPADLARTDVHNLYENDPRPQKFCIIYLTSERGENGDVKIPKEVWVDAEQVEETLTRLREGMTPLGKKRKPGKDFLAGARYLDTLKSWSDEDRRVWYLNDAPGDPADFDPKSAKALKKAEKALKTIEEERLEDDEEEGDEEEEGEEEDEEESEEAAAERERLKRERKQRKKEKKERKKRRKERKKRKREELRRQKEGGRGGGEGMAEMEESSEEEEEEEEKPSAKRRRVIQRRPSPAAARPKQPRQLALDALRHAQEQWKRGEREGVRDRVLRVVGELKAMPFDPVATDREAVMLVRWWAKDQGDDRDQEIADAANALFVQWRDEWKATNAARAKPAASPKATSPVASPRPPPPPAAAAASTDKPEAAAPAVKVEAAESAAPEPAPPALAPPPPPPPPPPPKVWPELPVQAERQAHYGIITRILPREWSDEERDRAARLLEASNMRILAQRKGWVGPDEGPDDVMHSDDEVVTRWADRLPAVVAAMGTPLLRGVDVYRAMGRRMIEALYSQSTPQEDPFCLISPAERRKALEHLRDTCTKAAEGGEDRRDEAERDNLARSGIGMLRELHAVIGESD